MKQKYFILSLVLAMTIALPTFAKEAEVEFENKAEVHGRVATTLGEKLKNVFEFRREDRQEDKMNRREDRASTSASSTIKIQKLHDEKGGFLGNIAGMRVKNVGKLFQKVIDRFEKIIDRLESRSDKIETAGGNTTNADASITIAKTNLTEAKADLSAFLALDFKKGSSTHATGTATTTLETTYQQAKTLAAEVRDDLRKVKENLMKAVSSLVEVQKTVKVNGNASTTATSTSN